MINVLIDTCSWIDLLSEEENDLLKQLEFWKDNNRIQIVTNEIVILEWNKHKENAKGRFYDSLNTKYKHAREVIKRENLYISKNINPVLEIIETQISTIDKLLEKALVLKTSSDIKAYCSDRTILPRKAPFHNKLDSTKDAYIIFSALYHFNDLKEDFIFISSNKNEFGAPNNQQIIHPELIEDFKDTKVSYFNNIGRAVHELKNILDISLEISINNINYKNDLINEIYIDISKPILDQLYDYILERYKEIKFVPLDILINHYPFKSDFNSHITYSLFSSVTDNEELFKLFKSIKIAEDGKFEFLNTQYVQNVENYENKIKKILTNLTYNLIFGITFPREGDSVIQYFDENVCNSPKCNYDRFEFDSCFNKLEFYIDSINDLIELGYLYYKIGNYIESEKKFAHAYNKSIKSKLFLSAFICQFNRSKLQIFIRNRYFDDDVIALIEELKNIDLSKEVVTLKDKRIFDWIQTENFYSSAYNEINDLVKKVIDHYYLQLNGGGSVNSEIEQLLNAYMVIAEFLNDNYIIYDKFSEFKKLCSRFFEGLFASHGIKESQYSRLAYFDDYLIIHLIHYGDSEDIKKFFSRYKLKAIKYQKTAKTGNSLNDLIENFFSKNENITESLKKVCGEKELGFLSFYNTLFNNILVVVSISDFDSKYYEWFLEKMLYYLENNSIIYKYNITDNIRFFLGRVSKKINGNHLKRLFQLSISNSNLHNEWLYDTIRQVIERTEKRISIKAKDFELIKSLIFKKCTSCNRTHPKRIAAYFFKIIKNSSYKRRIRDLIIEELNINFEFELYYYASIFGVIEFNNGYFDKALIFLDKRIDNATLVNVNVFGDEPKRDFYISSVINLCFKFNTHINGSLLDKIKNFEKYYEWLLNMDDFNYNDFQPSWIGEYKTRYYNKAIGTNKKVKHAVEKYLYDNTDSKIEKEYYNIFIRKKWGSKTK